MTEMNIELKAVGLIRSTIFSGDDAPKQGYEGAQDAWLELNPAYVEGLQGLSVGLDIIVLTWLHEAQRDVLQIHPRGEEARPLTGVFATRSPHRPNPLGLHRVTIRNIEQYRLRVGPIEAFDGTPVVDIKVALTDMLDF